MIQPPIEQTKALEGLHVRTNKNVGEDFARVNVVLSKLRKYNVIVSQLEIRRHVLSG